MKRPFWVKLIFAFFLISGMWTILSFGLILTGRINLQEPQRAYIESLSVGDHAITFLLASMNICGAVGLFLLRKWSSNVFWAALLLNLAIVGWHTISKGFLAALGGSGLIGMLIGIALLFAVCFYSSKLVKAGILK